MQFSIANASESGAARLKKNRKNEDAVDRSRNDAAVARASLAFIMQPQFGLLARVSSKKPSFNWFNS